MLAEGWFSHTPIVHADVCVTSLFSVAKESYLSTVGSVQSHFEVENLQDLSSLSFNPNSFKLNVH